MFICICKLYSLNLSLKYIDWLVNWFRQGYCHDEFSASVSRVHTAKYTVSCNLDGCLKDNYCALFFKLKFFTFTLNHIFCSPNPSKCYRESDFVKSVSRNKLRKYIFLWFKGAEAIFTNILTKNSNTLFFLQQPLPTLPKILLWKYFQICMYSFRENWKINLTIWHTVPRFNP